MMHPQTKNKYKISLTAVLNDEYESPFSLSDFEKFVQKEHSEENLAFWHSIMRYRENASKVFQNCPSTLRTRRTGSHSSVRSMSSVFNSTASLQNRTATGSVHGSEEPLSEDKERELAALKDEIEMIVTLYMMPGSDKEVNLPAAIRKKVLVDINEKKNYHPDVFKHVLEHTYMMMKTSTYPNFYRHACHYLQQKNLPFPEKRPQERESAAAVAKDVPAPQRDSATAQ
ncbi:uncharacterized protein SPPG_05252 [Spizellomyces punctatus DAOM BR117]|uniref:RGS domain-containing protein n=1 Tax=Spizellomyces punctatus (strain DAOM BR117) TaxID=645134 RepID=A0A0L0HEJ4_SPIPD|nr:uncharacterized protein SPPG_05252 [Spizellomyces punctatus DAOM BR117]KNC99880.1 hypothetical protein SPPG_05252 [Spizellomyces punctatus DAOM BR117]|eukprot:XP_016607920.1 hypothetical protein SPPG_05252 [Spizellomyces punctatus DAOM BR117]